MGQYSHKRILSLSTTDIRCRGEVTCCYPIEFSLFALLDTQICQSGSRFEASQAKSRTRYTISPISAHFLKRVYYTLFLLLTFSETQLNSRKMCSWRAGKRRGRALAVPACVAHLRKYWLWSQGLFSVGNEGQCCAGVAS